MLKDVLNADLKVAMLARETEKVEILRGLKSAILYAEVASNKRDEGLSESETIAVLRKESKKRQDSIDLYKQGGNKELADKETAEKVVIDAYLPEQLTEEATDSLISEAIKDLKIESPTKQDMGRIIGAVKASGKEVDGALVAKLINSRISQ